MKKEGPNKDRCFYACSANRNQQCKVSGHWVKRRDIIGTHVTENSQWKQSFYFVDDILKNDPIAVLKKSWHRLVYTQK